MIDIVEILRGLISDMVITVKVNTSIDNLDGTFTITTCNTQYLNECSMFTVNGIEYSIISIVNNESIIIQGSIQLINDFEIRAPRFIPDTPQGANNETVLRASDLERNPFIWLLENFRTEFKNDGGLNVAEARVRLFFLDNASNPNWLEIDHRKNCIEPMINLCDRFIKELENKVSGKLENYVVINRLKFGNTSNNKSILDENLSGVELELVIPVRSWAIKCKEC
jgi:hypothetical protein